MIIEEIGTLKVLFNETTGVSKAGNNWTAREFVVETRDGDFVTDLHFKTFSAEHLSALKEAKVGDPVQVRYKPAAREYNGKWYDELRLFHVSVLNGYDVATGKLAPEAGDDDLPL